MKKKETIVLCPTCGHNTFNRSLSEIDALIRLVFTAKSKILREIILKEGELLFDYRCTKCGAPFTFDSMEKPRQSQLKS